MLCRISFELSRWTPLPNENLPRVFSSFSYESKELTCHFVSNVLKRSNSVGTFSGLLFGFVRTQPMQYSPPLWIYHIFYRYYCHELYKRKTEHSSWLCNKNIINSVHLFLQSSWFIQTRLFRRCDSRTLPIKTFSLFITVTKTPIGPRHSLNRRNTSGSRGSSNVEDAIYRYKSSNQRRYLGCPLTRRRSSPLDTVPSPAVLFF